MSNLISASISPDDVNKILSNIVEIKKTFSFGIKMTPKERKNIPKIDDNRLSFVEKSLQFGKQEPGIVPPYTDFEELKRDVDLYKNLKQIEFELSALAEMVSDTRTAAGSDAYLAALSIYNSAKGAVKMGVPGSESIARELKSHFEIKQTAESKV